MLNEKQAIEKELNKKLSNNVEIEKALNIAIKGLNKY